MSQSRPVIHVILASVREVRLGAAIADWVMTQARTQSTLCSGFQWVRLQDQMSADASIVANLQVMPSHNQPPHSASPRSLPLMGSQLEATN